MSDERDVRPRLERDTALALFEWAQRFAETNVPRLEHVADAVALDRLAAALEDELPEAFGDEYPRLLEASRARVVAAYRERMGARDSAWLDELAIRPPAEDAEAPSFATADDRETAARAREVGLLIHVVEPDPSYQPLVVTDEASLLDLVGTDEGAMRARLAAYLGEPPWFELALPVWRVVDAVRARRPGWPEQDG